MTTEKTTPPNREILHITEINAPIETVWEKLIDLEDWKEWNLWTRLEAIDKLEKGQKGKLHASFEGNDKWQTYDFDFGTVSHEEHLLTWFGSVGPGGFLFYGNHTMQLEKKTDQVTKLIHKETFRGLLPRLNMGLPFQQMNENYLKMNEAFKAYIEKSSS